MPGNVQAFDDYMSHSKFLALPFEEADMRKVKPSLDVNCVVYDLGEKQLRERWQVKSWPWVVITDDKGKVLNPKGNDLVLGGHLNLGTVLA